MRDVTLKDRYGPWALLVGGSEGIGEHLARDLAAAGVNLVLVARKPDPLAATAQAVREAYGVEVRTLELDVTSPDLLERIDAVAGGLEIGLVVHNVGGGQSFGPVVERPLESALFPIQANCVAITKLAHRFGGPMAERGRGGLLFIGSLAGNAGSYFFAAYSAAKGWMQTFAEALWAELQPRGVDVLAFPIGATDTPARRRSGTRDTGEMLVADPAQIAREALDQLPNGPVHVAAENLDYDRSLCSSSRRAAAEVQRDLLLRMMPTRD
jgi:short-subunit dehydrogenase